MAGVYYRLCRIVHLTRLAGLYTDARIGVGGAVVRVVAQKFRANEMAVFIGLFAVSIGWLIFVFSCLPRMVLFYFFLAQVAYGLFF